MGLAADGTISGQPKSYSISKLRSLCRVTPANLNCQNLLTDITQPGNYTFRVSVIPTQGEPGTEITKTSDAIKIEAPPPVPPVPPTPVKIISFKVNGQEVSNKPKHSFAINKLRSDASVDISWEVQPGEDIKVELSPSPGAVGVSGEQVFPLSVPPSNETITLKVTNKAGEQTSQSVQIQTIEPNFPNQPASSGSRSSRTSAPGSGTNTPGNNVSPANSPTPSSSDKLSPMELPPKAD